MQVSVAQYLGLLSSYVFVAILIALLDLGLTMSTILLVLLPGAFLIWKLQPSWSILSIMAVFAVGSTLIWEAVAASNGLWYTVSDTNWKVLGVVPIELFLWSFVFNCFILLLYEYFIDDRWVEVPQQDRHVRWLAFFSVASIFVGVFASTVLKGVVISYAFAWLLTALVIVLGLAIWLSHSASRQVGYKALQASALLFPFFVVHELVALFNVHVVYANPSQYLYSFSLLDNQFPLEKLLFFILVPLWLVIVYELYLDDGQ